jgi:hypothetical protein
MIQLQRIVYRWLLLPLFVHFVLSVTACTVGLVQHGFSFDARESPGIEILDYRYGASHQPSARATASEKRTGRVLQRAGILGEMTVGDELYVRWRVRETERTYEALVNLAGVLPRDVKKHEIHFTVRGQQLFVYLITPHLRSPGEPVNGPADFQRFRVLTLSSTYGQQAQ